MHEAFEFMTPDRVGKEMYRAYIFFVFNAQRDITAWESPDWEGLSDEEREHWKKAAGKFISDHITRLDIATTAALVVIPEEK